MAGGNGVLSVLSTPVQFTADAGFGPMTPVFAGPGPSVGNEQGTSAPLAHVTFGVVGLFLVSVAALIFLNKAGFRFSVTVG